MTTYFKLLSSPESVQLISNSRVGRAERVHRQLVSPTLPEDAELPAPPECGLALLRPAQPGYLLRKPLP